MVKKKHIWHCGECHGDLFVTKKGKNTKYLYCPNCAKQVAYFNFVGMALTAGTLAVKGVKALKKLKGAGDVLGAVSGNSNKQPMEKQYIISDSKDKANMGERIINKELYGV